jgi:hydrogenase expression/formation protein HypD
MKQLDEFRQSGPVLKLAGRIRQYAIAPVRFMEVCGGHTMTLHKFGLLPLLPENLSLVSGPGCPVCVSGEGFIDALIRLVDDPSVILMTYGDLLRIPAGARSLEKARASGADVRVVYSVTEALSLAEHNPGKNIVFAGIGFETTAPLTAAAVLSAKKTGLKNFFVYSSHKVMPPAMEWIAAKSPSIKGFIAPGHVTAITGISDYWNLSKKYNVGVVVSGFEPVDMMLALLLLTEQAATGHFRVENAYRRVVRPEGNLKARAIMEEVFESADDTWRGLGIIPGSGLRLRKIFEGFDARKVFGVKEQVIGEPKGCICGKVITGSSVPAECGLFGTACTPEDPVGACMVSSEGTCSVWYRYRSAK